MLRVLQQFILNTLFAVFASQASAMFIQADWFDPTEPGVGTNRYSYSFNDPINLSDPNGNHVIQDQNGDLFNDGNRDGEHNLEIMPMLETLMILVKKTCLESSTATINVV